MKIDRNFRLYGFERKDFGLGGCVFFRWEEPKTEQKEPTIRSDNYYAYRYDMSNYIISIPKPQAKKLTGTVMITRQSKNRYSLAMHSEKGVRIIPLATSLSAFGSR